MTLDEFFCAINDAIEECKFEYMYNHVVDKKENEKC